MNNILQIISPFWALFSYWTDKKLFELISIIHQNNHWCIHICYEKLKGINHFVL